MAFWLFVWLAGCLFYWLFGGLVEGFGLFVCLPGWLDILFIWLFGCLFVWLVAGLIGCSGGWMLDCLFSWLVGKLFVFFIHLTVSLLVWRVLCFFCLLIGQGMQKKYY